MPQNERDTFLWSPPFVSPRHEQEEARIESNACGGDLVFKTLWTILIFLPNENVILDQTRQSVTENISGDVEIPLEFLKSLYSDERFAKNAKTPTIANDFERSRHGTGTSP